jgi:hypothetical protein
MNAELAPVDCFNHTSVSSAPGQRSRPQRHSTPGRWACPQTSARSTAELSAWRRGTALGRPCRRQLISEHHRESVEREQRQRYWYLRYREYE